MNGRDDTTTFLPLDFRIGGQSRDSCPTVGQYLTRDQARYVYKKVETGEMINTDMIQQEIEQEKQLNRMDDRNGEINPYRELIVNNAEKTEPPMTQMEQWSILSNVLNYVQHSKFNSMNHTLNVRPVNRYKVKPDTGKEFRELDFGTVPQNLQEEYLDVYEGIQSDIVSSSRFDENSDISTTYLGKIESKESQDKLKAEESFPISENGYTLGRLLDGTKCQLLLDTGTSKSFMSKSFYMQCKSLHTLPKFATTMQRIQVGNGQCIGILFIIPVIVEIHGHRFKIYTLVSEIHENVDLVLGIKNVFELEGVINSRDCQFEFLNRSVPIYPEKEIILKPDEQKLVKVRAPFIDEISGLAIIKIIDGGTYSTLLIKLKFTCNKAVLDIKNAGKDTMILRPKEMIGIVDIRSLGYYKIKQGILQQNLSRYYRFEEAKKLCEYFNKFVDTLRKEREQTTPIDKYPWLDPEDERRNMTDREILEKYIDLKNSCLNKEEKVKVMDMLFKYKEAFSLRDEIGTCPNIEVEIEVTDKSPFFIRPYHMREEDKAIIDKEMKRLCYMGILREGFLAYSSPVMLISRKLTKDKRVVTDFRHLNVRIAKNNLAYPLVRDTFSVLGNLKCEVLSVLDLKDAFHSLRLSENSKKYCGILPYFGSSSYLYQRMPMGLNISPSIWQSYINVILNCLQSKKYCEAIMDDLILFTPSKESHTNKLEDILKALLKNGLKISPKKCQLFKTSLQYMGNEIFIENKKVCVKPLRSRLEAIQKLQPPKTPKGCRSFAGVVNFLSMFCPELQKLLKPIYDLTRKGKPFYWGKEQQDSFKEIKCRLMKPPVLHMPNKTGRFHLYSDTSKFVTGSALYQIQNGKPKLIAYASKRLPEAAKSYSITELELCGLAINIASFAHLLKRVDFDAIVDHLALMHIIKSKVELATTRIKRLLELISSYSFNLYYMKGKDMILSDFLS